MPETLHVRPATPADAPELATVAGATFALACPPGMPPASIELFIAENLTAAHFEASVADPGRAVLVAERSGSAVGYVMLVHGEPYDDVVTAQLTLLPTTELSKIYVLPEQQGGTVARALLDAAIETGRAAGAAGMWLGTNQHNLRAQAFYAKSGFARVGTKRFWVGDHWEDDFVFELAL